MIAMNKLSVYLKKARYLTLALPIFIFAAMIWNRRWLGDDGLINTRVIHNILDGFGPVYNAGERVEAFTSPLWVLLLTVFGAIGFRPDAMSVYLGLILSIAGMVLATLGTMQKRRAVNEGRFGVGLPLGMLVYAVIPAAWDYGSSGLETGLGLAWLGGGFYYLISMLTASLEKHEPDAETANSKKLQTAPIPARHLIGFGLLLGLGPVIRPEMSVFSFAMMAPVVWGQLSTLRQKKRTGLLKTLLLFALAVGLIPVAYQIFRMGYYACITSNTAIAKEAFLSNWQQGRYYFENFFGLYRLYYALPILFLFFVADLLKCRSNLFRLASAALFVSGLIYIVYVVKVGGDFMHGRSFLPGLFGVLIPVSVIFPDDLGKKAMPRIVAAALVLAVVVWAAYCATSLRMPVENRHYIGDERGWYTRRAVVPTPTAVDDYRKYTPYKDAENVRRQMKKACRNKNRTECPGFVLLDKAHYGRVESEHTTIPVDKGAIHPSNAIVVMRGGIGIFGTVAGRGVHVVDRYGLVDPLGARLMLEKRGRPGHEKALSNRWLAARFADTEHNLSSDRYVRAAAAALRCVPIAALLNAVTAPLTFNRFVSNIVNAFDYQDIRIPTNPFDAKERFCQD